MDVEEDAMAEEWVVTHDCSEDGDAHIEYVFSHSSGIGISTKVRCECGQEKDLTNYSKW